MMHYEFYKPQALSSALTPFGRYSLGFIKFVDPTVHAYNYYNVYMIKLGCSYVIVGAQIVRWFLDKI